MSLRYGIFVWLLLFPTWGMAADIGLLTSPSSLTEDILFCEQTHQLLSVSQPTPSMSDFLANEVDSTRLEVAEQAFSLLDLERAENTLAPLLRTVREKNVVGPLRARIELLQTRVNRLLGDEPGYREALVHLGQQYLFSDPDPARIPPDLLAEIRQIKETIWSNATYVLQVKPLPQKMRINGYDRAPSGRIELPVGMGQNLLVEAYYQESGWHIVDSASTFAEPLDSPELAEQTFSELTYIWTIDAGGQVLVQQENWLDLWRIAQPVDALCEAIGDKAHGDGFVPGAGTTRSIAEHPGFWVGVGLAVAVSVGGSYWYYTEQQKSSDSGAIEIRW